MKNLVIFLLSPFMLVSAILPVQNKYVLSKPCAVTIFGTSNLRAWKDSVGNVSGYMVAGLNEDGTVDLHAIHIKMEVRSIKSDMGSAMDNKTYTALKADANPEIIFAMDLPVRLTQVEQGEHALFIKGELTLAGITRPVVMQVTLFKLGRGNLQLQGSQAISMTDYGVKPPTALFGTIRARPGLIIHFQTNFTINKNYNETFN